LKIGFYYHIPVIKKGDSSIYLPGYLGVFIDGLAKEVDKIVCYMHIARKDEIYQMDYCIKSSNVKLVELPTKSHMLTRAFFANKYLEPIRETLDQIDMMLIRGPSPLLPYIASLCKKEQKRFAFLLVGDYLKSLNGVSRMNPVKRQVLKNFYTFNKYQQNRLASDALLVTNNPDIREEYEAKGLIIEEIRTTTLHKDDFFDRNDTCDQETVRLAYAGRIESTKGIDDMLQAVYLLRKEKIDVELHIAGWDPSGGNCLKKLEAKAKDLQIEDKFIYHGKKNVGPDLLSFYRACDIFIIATRGNEGFPRTIWEAMSQSMPVIATKVGSIPKLLIDKENVYLVEQSSPKHIANAVKQLIQNDEMRKQLILKGRDLALTNTIEVQSKTLLNILKRVVL